MHETWVYVRYWYFTSFILCYNCTSTNCNRFNSCYKMTQLSEWHLQIKLCRNSKKIYNGSSVSCGQRRLIFHCMEQSTHTAKESGQRRTHMHTWVILWKLDNFIPRFRIFFFNHLNSIYDFIISCTFVHLNAKIF